MVRYLAEMFYGNALTPSVMMRDVMTRSVMMRGVMMRGDVGSRMSACQVVQVVMVINQQESKQCRLWF